VAKASAGQRILLIALLTIALMAPPTLLGIVGQQGLASAFVYGGIIAIGAAFIDLRLAAALSVVSGIAGAIAALLGPFAVAGAVFFGVFTGACALAARRGVHSAVLMAPVFISFVLVAPPQVADLGSAPAALLTGAFILVGGLWTTASARLLIGQPRTNSSREGLSLRATLSYAATMALVVGFAAWVVLSHAKYHEGAWLLLTLIMVLQPSASDTFKKSLQRLAGTLIGGVIALALIIVGVHATPALILGGLLLFAAFVLRYAVKRPYWEYVTLLTPAVILMDAPTGDTLRVAEDRVGFTIAAVVVSLALVLVVKSLLLWRAHERVST
jgi:MFS family permease